MHHDLASAFDDPTMRSDLEDLVRIPSVSASGYDPDQVRRSALATAGLLEQAGLEGVRLLEIDGAHPAVFGERAGPAGAPTVLLYAHHDVQPAGDVAAWSNPPFEPVERDGRLYGRGTSDDKCGIVTHAAVVRALGDPPVGVKVFVEGEEEIGSLHLSAFLERYRDVLAADHIVIADSANWQTGGPALTTSLRGLADCVVEVRTLDRAVHSGMFGGAVPDALTCLARLLATLHDSDGNVAIPGLTTSATAPLELDEAELRLQAGVVDRVALIGSGPLTGRLWGHPAVSVLAVDAPPVAESVNALVPVARAKVSLRIAPGDDPHRAMAALAGHLEANAPWGARVTVTPGAAGEAFALATTGPAYEAFRAGMKEAWDVEPVDMGVGGSIPFVAAFARSHPAASIVLTGAADPSSRAHGPDESVDLNELRRSALAEAVALRLLGGAAG